jgi:hypothetical protein
MRKSMVKISKNLLKGIWGDFKYNINVDELGELLTGSFEKIVNNARVSAGKEFDKEPLKLLDLCE